MNFISIFKQISYYILFFAIIVITASIPEDIDAQSQNKTYLIYIDKFKDEAMRQQKRYKIPASITLAQGLLESGAGNGELARKSNNHFGIKCHGVWQGEKVYYDDDEKGECFRKYDDPMQSYEDHSLFLTSRPRYAELFNLKITDYRGWAVGLKKCGYATDKAYASKLIGIIELYNLNRYDLQALKKGKKNQEDINPHTPYISWGRLYIEAKEGDTFESISNEFGIKRRKLAKYNELLKDHTFKEGEIIYLQEKNKYSKKGYKYHIVKEGESLHSIAQKYGMKLSNIYALNRKYNNWIPNVGDKIQLNRRRK